MEKNRAFLRFLPLVILLVLLLLSVYFKFYTYLSFESLKHYHHQLLDWKNSHFLLASIAFVVTYIISVAISIPGSLFLSITAGFLFGLFLGTAYVVLSATIGAILLFLSVKFALLSYLEKKAGHYAQKMEKGFQENAFSYLMVLRLIPLFPFWVVNIVPALLGVNLRTFATTTFLGIIPGAFVYVWIGTGLNAIFETNQNPNLHIIFSPSIFLPLLALAFLSLIPVMYKKLHGKNHG